MVACRLEAELQAAGSAQNKQHHEHLYYLFCVFVARVPCRPDRYFWKLLSANSQPTGKR